MDVVGHVEKDKHECDRGVLPDEPCRCCHRSGGVWFVIDDSPFGKTTAQVVSCEKCGNTWTV